MAVNVCLSDSSVAIPNIFYYFGKTEGEGQSQSGENSEIKNETFVSKDVDKFLTMDGYAATEGTNYADKNSGTESPKPVSKTETETENYNMCPPNYYDNNTFTKVTCKYNNVSYAFKMPLPMTLMPDMSNQTWESTDVSQLMLNMGADKKYNGWEILAKAINGTVGDQAQTILKQYNDASRNVISQFFQDSIGVVYNPNKMLQYGGEDLRSVQLSIFLTPTSKKNSEQIHKGIRRLLWLSFPTMTDIRNFSNDVSKLNNETKGFWSSIAGASFLGVPPLFDLEIVINRNTLFKRRNMRMTSVKPNLMSSSNISWHEDGSPIQISLDLSFIETNIATKGRMKEEIWMNGLTENMTW